MATATVDLPYLSNYLSLPQGTLDTLTTSPTTELVQSVLEAVAIRAREHDETKAERLRLDVELENAVRSGDSRTQGLKSTIEKSLKENGELRTKLQEQENARSALESELQSLRSSSSTSTSELQSLRSRVSSLEASNRDTVSLLESKSTAHDRLAEELSAQHQKTIELRREVASLEQSLQAANSASTTAKFRESNLRQEIDLVKRSNEWFEAELKTKGAELSKTRKDKSAKISELQRQSEDANSTIESLRRTESTLRSRLEEVAQKADDAFAKVQRMQEEATKEQESFRKELESAQRLAELFEGSMSTARERLQEVQVAFDQSKDDAAEEIGRIRAEAETDRSERESSDQRVMELEVQVERLEADLANQQQHDVPSLPGTPRRGMNGLSSASPGGARMKGGLNFTQMYSEYSAAKQELETERRRNQTLSTTIDEMILDLEKKQPQMEELRVEHERLEAEVIEMTALLEDIGGERDKAKKDARKWEGQVEGLRREGELLRQQLRDLSAQVKVLLSEVHARAEGHPELDPVGQSQLEQAARDELDEATLEGLTATGQLISRRLLTFRNIKELQEQNTSLLRTVRELGDDLEGAEARRNQDQQAQDHLELESLRVKVNRYKDEMKSMVMKSQSYIKERDMFRRMLQHRGQLAPNADLASLFGQSMDSMPPMTPSGRGLPALEQQSPNARDAADLGRVIKEMQQHFDAYREEASTDHRALKEQSERLSREKNDLQAEVSRTSSQVTLARERFEMLQANYNMLQHENAELQKRSHALSESAAKQDLRTQQVAEELIEAKALMDSMRNESANLKAEKELWKRIEKRLAEDNESLMNERSRLNGLIGSMQSLQNERELSDSDTRRKLQAQVESLDSELQATKRKLDEEIEDSKRAVLRRDYEKEQSQKNIDDLRAGLGAVREELVATKTTKDHLQARVDELVVELKSAEERVQVLQPRPTARSTTARTTAAGAADAAGDAADTISREQELAVEVSELRRDLDLARRELDNARAETEQYKAISQASEEELQQINDTREQYREDIERDLETRDAKIRALEQNVQDLTTEMSSVNAELSTLRAEQGQKAREKEDEKNELRVEIARLKDEDERHATAAQFHQEDLKAQAEIAQQAQQSYENELVKHAEAAQALQKTRAEYHQLRTEVVELRTEAEAAKVALSQSESSWEETRERYEREVRELRTNGRNVDAQNKLLHQQLESVSRQISSLQESRTALAGGSGDTEGSDVAQATSSDQSVEELRELVRYIREGKEIVDVQLDLSNREAKRLKQQLDYAQSQLDDTRLKLDQERRLQADQSRSAMTHTELVEKINELNLYRESTVTLRNEARQAQAQLAETSKKVEELIGQIQPLKATIQQLENDKETMAGEMKLLQEDRDRYQQRNQNILQKYDRVDPAELEGLKEKISALEAEKETWQPLREQVDGIPEQIRKAQEEVAAQWNEGREKLKTQFKERSRVLVQAKNEKTAEAQALAKEKEELETRLADLGRDLESARAQKTQAVAAASSPPVAGDDSAMQDTEVAAANDAELQALQARAQSAELRAQEAQINAQALQMTIDAHQTRIMDLENQIASISQELVAAKTQLEHAQLSLQQATDSQTTESAAQLEQLQHNLTEAQREVENLKTNAAISELVSNGTGDEESRTVSERVEEIKAELETRYAERVRVAEEQYKRRADGMRTQLNKQIKESKDQIRQQVRQQVEAEFNEKIEALNLAHGEEIAKLHAQHQGEIEEALQRQQATRAEAAQASAAAENAPSAGTGAEESADQEPSATMSGPVSEWRLSDAQARELVGSNNTLKSILRSNIATQVKKAREEQEHMCSQKLKEAGSRAEREKEQAMQMAEQRQKVKLSMAEGKARTLGVRVEIVQKAAAETPQRAVGEVWEIAKSARPTAPAPIQQAGKVAQPSPGAGQASPSTPHQGKTEAAPAIGLFGQPTPPRTFGQLPSSTTPTTSPFARAQEGQAAAAPAPTNPFQQQATAAPDGSPSALPVKPGPAQAQPNAGTGPAALRSLTGAGASAIPRGGAVAARGGRGGRGGQAPAQASHAGQPNQQGASQLPRSASQSGLPRGGGRGRGGAARGGGQQQNVAAGSAVPGQPGIGGGRGALNAGARQYVPGGGKRQREDGEAGEVGSAGKRARGGGAGS